MAKSAPLEDVETENFSRHCMYFKKKVLNNHKSIEIKKVITESINSKTFVFSDKSKTYDDMADYNVTHLAEKS